MKPFFLALLLLGECALASAQNIVLYDPVNSRTYSSERYSGVNGSPFLFDKWISGNATGAHGTYADLQLKLDVYGNVLVFNRNEEVREFAEPVYSFVLKPVPADSSSYLHFTRGVNSASLKEHQFVQVLAKGKLTLYKSVIKLVSDVNEINQGVVKTFTNSTRYYLKKGDECKLIKLSKKELMPMMADKEESISTYAKEKGLSFSNESGVAAIIAYYNQ